MDRSYVGLAEAQARLYFLDLGSWLRDLQGAHEALVLAMTTLLEEYDRVVPLCKLRLYPRNRPGSFGPTALYWGTLFRLHPASSGEGRREPVQAIHHLKGTFDPGWVYTIAKRYEQKDRFLDFDRRRLALNAACRAVTRALRAVKRATAGKGSSGSSPAFVPSGRDGRFPREVPAVPEELLPRGLSPGLRAALRSGWGLSFSLGFCEEEFCELGVEVRENPSLGGLGLVLERGRGSFYRRAVWSPAAGAKTRAKMTDRMMRELRVRQGARPVLALKELKRRRIARLQAEAGERLQAIREACSDAQREVAKGLAQATGVVLSPANAVPGAREAV